jgi:hypothetical protein
MRRSQKSKKYRQLDCLFCAFAICNVKAAHRTLMKLTTGVNFINVLRMNFLYKRRFGSFFSSYMYVVKAELKRRLYEKCVRIKC